MSWDKEPREAASVGLRKPAPLNLILNVLADLAVELSAVAQRT